MTSFLNTLLRFVNLRRRSGKVCALVVALALTSLELALTMHFSISAFRHKHVLIDCALCLNGFMSSRKVPGTLFDVFYFGFGWLGFFCCV